jgi:hypothetical protein
MKTINEKLLAQIDTIELSNRLLSWRKAMRAAPWRLSAEREKYTVAPGRKPRARTSKSDGQSLLKTFRPY